MSQPHMRMLIAAKDLRYVCRKIRRAINGGQIGDAVFMLNQVIKQTNTNAKTDTKITTAAKTGGSQGGKGQGGTKGAVFNAGTPRGAGAVAESEVRHTEAWNASENAARAENGKEMLSLVRDHADNDPETNLVDGLANLMHYARSIRLNFENALRIAKMHFEEEQREATTKTKTK